VAQDKGDNGNNLLLLMSLASRVLSFRLPNLSACECSGNWGDPVIIGTGNKIKLFHSSVDCSLSTFVFCLFTPKQSICFFSIFDPFDSLNSTP